MAGHSKWAQIKRQKQAADFRKGQIFSKLAREIHVAVREGGPNPETNVRLRMAIERAKREGMPKETIENAIAKASGAAGGAQEYETIVYEGYGPGGIAIMAIALTDNRNRTASLVRHTFTKYGGSLGETGSVAWQFETLGQIVVATNDHDAEEIALAAIDAGARDFEVEDDTVIITTEPDQLSEVVEKLQQSGYQIRQADVQRVPTATVELEGSQAQSALKLLEALEDLDDVQEVYTNASFPAEVRGAV